MLITYFITLIKAYFFNLYRYINRFIWSHYWKLRKRFKRNTRVQKAQEIYLTNIHWVDIRSNKISTRQICFLNMKHREIHQYTNILIYRCVESARASRAHADSHIRKETCEIIDISNATLRFIALCYNIQKHLERYTDAPRAMIRTNSCYFNIF